MVHIQTVHEAFNINPMVRDVTCLCHMSNACVCGLIAVCIRAPGSTNASVCSNPASSCYRTIAQPCTGTGSGDPVCCPYLGNTALVCLDRLCVPFCDPGAADCNYQDCNLAKPNSDCTLPTPPSPKVCKCTVALALACSVQRLKQEPHL